MSFGENIQFYRKKENMTQEELAEKMNVSRQTVSKWESDASFPETDKILQLCSLFSCNMDTLMRGNAEDSTVSDTAEYDREQNRFTFAIAGGVTTILAGVTLYLVLYGLGTLSEAISTMILMVFIIAAVMVFIVSGINHDGFIKQHPQIKPFYKNEEIERFSRRFPLLIALPTGLILIGVVLVIGLGTIAMPSGWDKDRWNSFCSVPMLFLVTVSVPMYIYAGMQKSKYDIDTYNKEHAQDEETLKKNKMSDAISGCIMLTATAAFLLMGFLGNLWSVAWVVFPVGGILCGIVSTAMDRK